MYSEQAGHGTSVYAAWGIPFVPGHEQCLARFTPDGALELRIGAHSHGQGLETTLSQVAHSILGVPHDRIRLVHGDTALTPYSTGTWGSRSMIMSGGAVAAACDQLAERLIRVGASLLQAKPAEVALKEGMIISPSGRMAIAEVARTWYRRPQDLPPEVEPAGLEVTAGYKAKRDSGTFSYAAHAAVVAVDPGTGMVEILDYVVVEDGGVLVNPLIVDGQIWGGTAQGIGTALYEEMAYDAQGQPLASTLADYLLPGPAEVPDIRIVHLQTASPYTRFGQKGLGEGGAIAPPAAITNAINDALKDLGAELLISPATPRRIAEAVDRRARQGHSMKPAAFDYVRPATLPEALALLAEVAEAKVLAGGQTLGPMLNLRLAQPPLLVDITRIAELAEVAEDGDGLWLGAIITHAAIEDGRVKDPTHGFLAQDCRRHRLSGGAHARHHRR